MASMSPDSPTKPWEVFVREDYIPAVLEAQELVKVQDPDTEPFKSKYLAIEKLSNLRHQGTSYSRSEGLLSAEEKAECKDMLAMLDVKRGTLALDTEDPSLADKLLTSATQQLKIAEERNVEALQDAYNLLGVIWSNRDEQTKAESYLLEAQQLYRKYRAPKPAAPSSPPSVAEPAKTSEPASAPSQAGGNPGLDESGVSSSGEESPDMSGGTHEPGPSPPSKEQNPDLKAGASKVEKSTTAFASPDTHARRDDQSNSANSDPGSSTESSITDGGVKGPDRSDFLYTMTAFYLAQVYGHSAQQDKMAEYLGVTLDRQLRMGHNFEPLEWAQNCAQLSGYYIQQGDYETAAHCLAAAGVVLERANITLQTEHGGDVVANVLIGWGKLHMQIIGNSRSLFNSAAGGEESTVGSLQKTVLQDRSNREPSANSKTSASKATPQTDGQGGQEGRRKPRFASLNLPPSDALSGCDEKGEVHSYEDAVKQFNKGLTALKQALEYYQLDGHVTEHCNILFDISALHKYLAFLEPSEGRVCQLQKRRATRLEPVASTLNPNAFPDIWRQLTYELASINQEILDVRLANGRPFSKYGTAAKDAVQYYTLFLDSFKDPKGKMPDRIGEAEEGDFLLAQVQLAMVYYKLYNKENAERRIEDLVTSLDLYTTFLRYVEKHTVKGMDERVRVCREMAELLPTKISAEKASVR